MMRFFYHSRRQNQSGNMLIYILGGIFLLGILIVLLKGNAQEGAGIDADKIAVSVQKMFGINEVHA